LTTVTNFDILSLSRQEKEIMNNMFNMFPANLSNKQMLEELAKRTGGIPDFAKEALKKAGVNAKDVDDADTLGRK